MSKSGPIAILAALSIATPIHGQGAGAALDSIDARHAAELAELRAAVARLDSLLANGVDSVTLARIDSLEAADRRLFANDSTVVAILNRLGATDDSLRLEVALIWQTIQSLTNESRLNDAALSARIDSLHAPEPEPPEPSPAPDGIVSIDTLPNQITFWIDYAEADGASSYRVELWEEGRRIDQATRRAGSDRTPVPLVAMRRQTAYQVRVDLVATGGTPPTRPGIDTATVPGMGGETPPPPPPPPPPPSASCAVGDMACRTRPPPAGEMPPDAPFAATWVWCTYLGGTWAPWSPTASCYTIPG